MSAPAIAMSMERIATYCQEVVTAYDLGRQAPVGISTLHEAGKTMKPSGFPEGWDEKRVSELLAHYETQSEEEIVAEDEAISLDPERTVMEVSSRLVPAVRGLIAKHEEAA